MIPNRIVSGNKAEILAYGFSGKSPYHFSSRYLIPCATKIETGKIRNTTASGLNPVIIIPNIISTEAIELRDAKKPLVVENSPISAKAKIGKLISGDKNTLSILLYQENSGANPDAILPKNSPSLKSFANRSSMIVPGW